MGPHQNIYMKLGVLLLCVMLIPSMAFGQNTFCEDVNTQLTNQTFSIDDGSGPPEEFEYLERELCRWGCGNTTGAVSNNALPVGECNPHPVTSNLMVGGILIVLLIIAYFVHNNQEGS